MKHIFLMIAIAAVMASCNMGGPQTPDNSAQLTANKAANQRFYDEVFNKHNLAAIDTLVAADFKDHSPEQGYTDNREGMKKSMADFLTAFPDMAAKIDLVVAEGDLVTTEWTFTGTNTGAMMGMPATGKKVNVEGIDIIRLKDGKATEHWGYYEQVKMMQQLGVMPVPGDSTSKK